MTGKQSGTVPGWRSFVENAKKKAASQNLTFVYVEVPGGLKSGKKSQTSKKRKLELDDPRPQPEQQSPSPGDQELSSRRQQVYDAQMRHRSRKVEYAESLKEEIEKLKHQQYLVNSEEQKLARENALISQYLVSQGLLAEADLTIPQAHVAEIPNISVDGGRGIVPKTDGDNNLTSPNNSHSAASDFSKKGKTSVLLDESECLDRQPDLSSGGRIEECRNLLLRDIRPFYDDETDDKKTWDALADLILDER